MILRIAKRVHIQITKDSTLYCVMHMFRCHDYWSKYWGGKYWYKKSRNEKDVYLICFQLWSGGHHFQRDQNGLNPHALVHIFHAVFDLHSLWGHYWLNRPSTPQAKFLVFAVIGLRVFFFFFLPFLYKKASGKSWLWRNHGLDSRSFVLFAFRKCFPTQMFTSFRI